MSNAPQIAEVAALVGDPARANMLCALLGGRALTATELAFAAGVSPQTTSGHLGKLFAARLVVLMKQGRHRYYRLAGPQVGQMLESIMNVALTGPPRFQPKSKLDDRLRHARTCYDHIAGVLGVALAERLSEREFVILADEGGEVTPSGMDFLGNLAVFALRRPLEKHVLEDVRKSRPEVPSLVDAAGFAPRLHAGDRRGAAHAARQNERSQQTKNNGAHATHRTSLKGET